MAEHEHSPVPDSSPAVQRVVAVLAELGHAHSPVWLSDSAHTAAQAAAALGVELGQIAKSIVFRRVSDDSAVLVVASGDRRVDEAKVAALVGALRVRTPPSSRRRPGSPSAASRRSATPRSPSP